MALAVGFGVGFPLAGCAQLQGGAPGCEPSQRLAIVAQSVSQASFVPCLAQLTSGWKSTSFRVANGHSGFTLLSNQAGGLPVKVELLPRCDVSGAPPTTPRASGVRTYRRLRFISPRYAGTLYDVFPGGCVTYRFDFARGPHIALTEEFQSAVGLVSRRELRVELHKKLGLELDQ